MVFDTLLFVSIAFVSSLAGALGALLGLGGGIILVPALTLLFGVPIHFAIGASIVAVIATSTAGALTYIEAGKVNLRLGMLLEVGTTIGSLIGALASTSVGGDVLKAVFGFSLIYASLHMLASWHVDIHEDSTGDSSSRFLNLNGSYYDEALAREVRYGLVKVRRTFGLSFLAGVLSGLLGVGGGIVKVPAMNVISRVPMKAATATSNFMIGVTGAAGALVYFNRQVIRSDLVAPVVLGVLLGAFLGAYTSRFMKGVFLKRIFAVVLMLTAFRLILSGIGVA